MDPRNPDAEPLTRRMRRSTDLAIVAALALVAAVARFLPEGDVMRLALTLPVLLFVPGYLLIQTIVTRSETTKDRWIHGAVSVGLSPPIVGLLALSTAFLPGGFQPTPIVMAVTIGCLALAAGAFLRRNPDLIGRKPVPQAA